MGMNRYYITLLSDPADEGIANERRSVQDVMRHGMYEKNSSNKYRTGFGNAYHARSQGI